MKYACIEHRRSDYPIRMMCRLLRVSASGFYAWRIRPESQRAKSDRELVSKIKRIHAQSKGVYGSPKIRAELVSEGCQVGRNRVARLMRLERVQGCPRRRFRVTTQQPEDRLFVFVQSLAGPPMPLAVVSKRAKDLPLTVTLSDSMAMLPEMRLSNFEDVRVGARISKSGDAKPQSGDFQGEISPVKIADTEIVEVVISKKIP